MAKRSGSRRTGRRNDPPLRTRTPATIVSLAVGVVASSCCLLAREGHSLATTPSTPAGGGGMTTTPESVVRAQLSALRKNDLYRVFQYASPSNKAATGPWERFAKMVQSEPYAPLVGHDRAEVLLVRDGRGERDGWRGLVRVWPSPASTGWDDGRGEGDVTATPTDSDSTSTTKTVEYWWFLSRCADRGSPYEGRWLVDGVMPV